MQRRFIRIAGLASTPTKPGRWPVAPATVWRWVKAGELAPPVRLGPQVSAWPMEVIEAHERARAHTPADVQAQTKAGAVSVAVRRAKRDAGGG